MPESKTKRVISVSPMPPEKCAYALARYSRSPDSIRESLAWVRTHDSQKFLESFYFQYGHASIADLGHAVLCFEGLSELAATEIEEEPLWDGQAKSSRYQDFSRAGFITPPELAGEAAARYRDAARKLLDAYAQINARAFDCLAARLPCPGDMKPEAYRRNLAARAFDVARYLLFWGIPTNVGQVTSIRTLEKQIRRLKAAEYQELRDLGDEIAQSCAAEPDCVWDAHAAREALAPTLARHAEADEHAARAQQSLLRWAEQNLPPSAGGESARVDLMRPTDTPADIVATLLYPVTDRPFRELYEMARGWSAAQRAEVLDVALASRTRRDEICWPDSTAASTPTISRSTSALIATCTVTAAATSSGKATPDGWASTRRRWWKKPAPQRCIGKPCGGPGSMHSLPVPGAHYLLPFGARVALPVQDGFRRSRVHLALRSGVKGHFSYREVAWEMKLKMEQLEPELGRLIEATPPWVEDPLKR
jgi:thymidylate synthase ThyX